jgi:hypothetical protein
LALKLQANKLHGRIEFEPMSDSSLIPERQLVFSPGLAATVGLEEAVLLQQLGELLEHRQGSQRDGFDWFNVERQWLLDHLPFWTTLDLHRVCKSLVDKGIILVSSPPLHESEKLVFALNQANDKLSRSSRPARQTGAEAPAAGLRSPGAGLLPPSWTPSEDLLQLLQLNHTMPRQFVLDQLEDFVFYWRERGEISHAWENKFRQWVLSRWRRREQDDAERFTPPADVPIDNSWYPNPDALEIILRTGVSQEFIDDAVPEFILYWRERGETVKTLNSKFVTHIRRQWNRFNSALSHDTEPHRIPDEWEPKADVYDILRMCHIDEDFARALVSEFVVYWRDTNRLHNSWNTKFLQHVKYQWAHRHQFTQSSDSSHAGQQKPGSTGSTRSRSIQDDLTDRSWAH